MKKQTYISYLEDSDGKMINFERWSYKKTDTIIEKLKELYQYPIYKKDIEKSVRIAIYETPDGYNKNKTPKIIVPIEEIIIP